MRNQILVLILFFCSGLWGCTFISEPDIGASSEGPGFYGDDGEPDPLGEGQSGASEGAEVGGADQDREDIAPSTEAPDADTFADAFIETVDSEVSNSDALVTDAELSGSDSAVASTSDSGLTEPEPRDCGTEGCTENGYCDDERRPECWIGDQPACYAFQGREQTNAKAYARCCGHLGSCGPAGQWCEPPAPLYCALEGDPSCAINGRDPISQYLCSGREP